MTDLPQRIHDCPDDEASLRAMSDEVLLVMGWTLDAGVWISPDGVQCWPAAIGKHRIPHPMASVDDGMALAGDKWFLVLTTALTALEKEVGYRWEKRQIKGRKINADDLGLLRKAICEALARVVEVG